MGYGAEGMKCRFHGTSIFLVTTQKMYAFSNHVHVTENEGQSWK